MLQNCKQNGTSLQDEAATHHKSQQNFHNNFNKEYQGVAQQVSNIVSNNTHSQINSENFLRIASKKYSQPETVLNSLSTINVTKSLNFPISQHLSPIKTTSINQQNQNCENQPNGQRIQQQHISTQLSHHSQSNSYQLQQQQQKQNDNNVATNSISDAHILSKGRTGRMQNLLSNNKDNCTKTQPNNSPELNPISQNKQEQIQSLIQPPNNFKTQQQQASIQSFQTSSSVNNNYMQIKSSTNSNNNQEVTQNLTKQKQQQDDNTVTNNNANNQNANKKVNQNKLGICFTESNNMDYYITQKKSLKDVSPQRCKHTQNKQESNSQDSKDYQREQPVQQQNYTGTQHQKKSQNNFNEINNHVSNNSEGQASISTNGFINKPYLSFGANRRKSSSHFQHIQETIFKIKNLYDEAEVMHIPNYESAKCSKTSNGVVKHYAVTSHQGLIRQYNEDRVTIILNISQSPDKASIEWPKMSFFGIYDGHGGVQCADFLKENLHSFIINDKDFPQKPKEAIKKGFEKAEKEFNQQSLNKLNKDGILERSGSCAITLLIIDDICYIANVGDSRAILSAECGKKIFELSKDQKASDEQEQRRVIDAGGKIYQQKIQEKTNLTKIMQFQQKEIKSLYQYNQHQQQYTLGPYRVLPGRLSVTRSFGDLEAKLEKLGGNPNVVIAIPEIKSFRIQPKEHDFIIVGCDGIYDNCSSQDIVKCFWDTLKVIKSNQIHSMISGALDQIMKLSLVRKSQDNITALVIAFDYLQQTVCPQSTQQQNTPQPQLQTQQEPNQPESSAIESAMKKPIVNNLVSQNAYGLSQQQPFNGLEIKKLVSPQKLHHQFSQDNSKDCKQIQQNRINQPQLKSQIQKQLLDENPIIAGNNNLTKSLVFDKNINNLKFQHIQSESTKNVNSKQLLTSFE